MELHPTLQETIRQLASEHFEPVQDRKLPLLQLTDFVQHKLSTFKKSELVFICTHNSRRSHFGQIWAKVLADYYHIDTLDSYSGGTQATAFHPNAIKALEKLGFQIVAKNAGDNPTYEVTYAQDTPPIEVWSKVYADSANPSEGFCAIMTCSEANEACPIVLGAEKRISLPYEDPKEADGTSKETETYLERCRQIAAELMFALSSVQPRK